MTLIDKYIGYIGGVRRYSARTVSIYGDVLHNYVRVVHNDEDVSDAELVSSLNRSEIRQYEATLLESGLAASTIGLHLSALSGFCRYLVRNGYLESNPVRLVPKPKPEKRLPVYFRKESMEAYFEKTSYILDEEELESFKENWNTASGKALYDERLSRLIVSLLYGLGIRRAELIALRVGDIDSGRNIVKVTGKGDKMREIPLIA
ncbi:MAG: site-specific integrase, partial [Bacteroidales bacterium]|nr:site-specific integrase [Bacteroidales bacterium]